jgi:hypothetical protein
MVGQPSPVHVGPQVLRGIEVDHQLHTLHVDTSGSGVCADEADGIHALESPMPRSKDTHTCACLPQGGGGGRLQGTFPEASALQKDPRLMDSWGEHLTLPKYSQLNLALFKLLQDLLPLARSIAGGKLSHIHTSESLH